MRNKLDQYRPLFSKDSLVRTVQNGSETIYLYQGRGLVPDSKTDKYLDYAPIKNINLEEAQRLIGSEVQSSTASAFCQGCTLYKYPEKFSIITNPDKQVVRITEYQSPTSSSWWYLPIIFLPILILWLVLKVYRK